MARFGVDANLCGASFAAANATGDVVAAPRRWPAALPRPTARHGTPATVIYNDSAGGAKSGLGGVAIHGVADFGLDNALCQHALVSGNLPLAPRSRPAASLPGAKRRRACRHCRGAAHSANLRGKPTIIAAGRSDALVPVKPQRAPTRRGNRTIEGAASKLRYIEVVNDQHF